MSNQVTSICVQHRFGSASRKHVVCYLADKASDDGTGIWCSKTTIARDTELSQSTVKRVISGLLRDGLILKVGERKCSHGFTIEYRLNLEKISDLTPTFRTSTATGLTLNPVHDEPSRGVMIPSQDGPSRTPNHPSTIHQPPARGREEEAMPEAHACFEKIWSAYPANRQRSKTSCHAAFCAAVGKDIDPRDILEAVIKYKETTSGYSQSRIKYSDNWFRDEAWRSHIEQKQQEMAEREHCFAATLANYERWIKEASPMCVHIKDHHLESLLQQHRITVPMIEAAGLSHLTEVTSQ